VGRRIEATFIETMGLSDSKGLANKITGSLVDASNSTSFASSFIDAIPKEKQEEMGITEEFLSNIKSINQNLKRLAEKSGTPYVMINEGTMIWQTTQEGDNIVASTNVEETFNKIIYEIEKTDIDSRTKERAKKIVNELKEEIGRERPDKSKIIKMWDEFRALVPFVAPLLMAIVRKVLLGW
jgi:hypothetical protein